MPEAPVMMVNIETGDFIFMHSVDAKEAAAIGDHRYATAEEMAAPNEQKAVALNRMRNVNTNAPPELQTPEQRAATRAMAAEEAKAVAAGEVVTDPVSHRQALGSSVAPATPAHAEPAHATASHAEESHRRSRT
jgi:hypothetical protein